MDPEVSLDHGELEHGQEVQGGLLVTGGDTAGMLEPADTPLDDVPLAI